jgi:hypothetical protein
MAYLSVLLTHATASSSPPAINWKGGEKVAGEGAWWPAMMYLLIHG